MDVLLLRLGHGVELMVEMIAIAVIAIGALEAIVNMTRVFLAGESTGLERRAIWLDFARWLVAALTFQLAADLAGTAFAPNWEDIGHLAAIAAIRTFLSHFLDREVDNARKLQHRSERDALPRPA